ncbi:MAG: hypothetical protein JRI95_15160 [Deltaproteobacteria bacterium]|nr:hypothetical protein [Deltaproteobacteria bacterium]
MQMKQADPEVKPALNDRRLCEASPFLAELVGRGRWTEGHDRDRAADELDFAAASKDFRRQIRKMADDPEEALLLLRRFRIRTLLDLARADLENRLKPQQMQIHLRRLGDLLLYGAWTVAENVLRQKYVHPLILERRSVMSPVAVCSLSRLGSMEPLYTTAPAPIFVHSRAAEFAPALREKDFVQARRSGKEWLPARDYFLRLTSRTLSYLWAPDAGGKRFDPMGEDHLLDRPALLPGPLVILFSTFEDHFLNHQPPTQALSLLRLRFAVGQKQLGRAVEAAARETLIQTALKLGPRLKTALDAWFKDRSRAEGLPMIPGGLLDIERTIRGLQFRYAPVNRSLLVPSPLKALNLMAREGMIAAEQQKTLSRSYIWQWFIVNRLALLGNRSALKLKFLRSNRLDDEIGLKGASARTLAFMEAAQSVSRDLFHEGKGSAAA